MRRQRLHEVIIEACDEDRVRIARLGVALP
jgi:hypothetical protein